MRIDKKKLIELLKTPGVSFSGSDWKYGYPHKFYIDKDKEYFKFYTADELKGIEEGSEIQTLIEKFFKIKFTTEDGTGRLMYRTIIDDDSKYGYFNSGFQMFGKVGTDGNPDYSKMRGIREVFRPNETN